MSIKVGINGFGRIGRMVVRRAIHHPEIEIVGINDLCPADYLAYMLKYDTMHGKFDGEVKAEENAIIIGGKRIPVSSEIRIFFFRSSGRQSRHKNRASLCMVLYLPFVRSRGFAPNPT